MTERNVETVVDRLLGDDAPHLNESVTRTIASRFLGAMPPKAIVVSLDSLASSAWGTCRRFAILGPVEVYA